MLDQTDDIQLTDTTKHLLDTCMTGTLATIDTDGTPYCIPVHFTLLNNAIYVHSRLTGQKINNITANPHVCFTVYEMHSLILNESNNPCKTNTSFTSTVIKGDAHLITDAREKQEALTAIIAKYTPHLKDQEMPLKAQQATAVIKITISEITDKQYV